MAPYIVMPNLSPSAHQKVDPIVLEQKKQVKGPTKIKCLSYHLVIAIWTTFHQPIVKPIELSNLHV